MSKRTKSNSPSTGMNAVAISAAKTDVSIIMRLYLKEGLTVLGICPLILNGIGERIMASIYAIKGG